MRTIKQLLITVAVLLCSVVVNAHDFEIDGIYYNVISFTDFTVAVTYKGDNYNSFSNEYTGDVVIPSTVTYKSKTLSVTEISQYAFYDCRLKSISIPNSVIFIDNYAFKSCPIGNLRIEDGTETLSLGYNYDGSYYSYVGEGLFYSSSRTLETLYLGRNLSYETHGYFGYSPFASNSTLTSVTIGSSVTSIGNYAFKDCSGLTAVHVSDIAAWCNINFAYNYSNPLYYAKNLYLNGELVKDLVIPEGVKYIMSYAFKGYGKLTSVTIPNSVTSIGREAFYNCSGLTSVTIPECVTSIGESAFSYCYGLTSVTIGTSVTSIGEKAFYNCSGLTSVTIGNSVTSIGREAFYNCSGLTSIYLLGTTPPTVGYNNFTNSQYMNLTVYVPKGSLATYQSADVWKNFWDIQELLYAHKIILNKQNITTTVNSGYKLQATVYPENTTDKTIIWTSSNESIVRVSSDGKITGVSVGEAIITATCGSVSASCRVEVEVENFIKTQPTVENLIVELNTLEEGVKYQWYQLVEEMIYSKEIVPTSSGNFAWTESNGVWTSGNSLEGLQTFSVMTATIKVQLGDTISFDYTVPKGDGNSYGGSQWFQFTINGKTNMQTFGGMNGGAGHYELGINDYIIDHCLNGDSTMTIGFECVRKNSERATVSNIKHTRPTGFGNGEEIITGATSAILDESLFEKGSVVYCVVTLPNGKKLISDKVDTGATNIVNVNSDTEKNEIYNLRGLRIIDTEGLPRGIYIINGKKTFVK